MSEFTNTDLKECNNWEVKVIRGYLSEVNSIVHIYFLSNQTETKLSNIKISKLKSAINIFPNCLSANQFGIEKKFDGMINNYKQGTT